MKKFVLSLLLVLGFSSAYALPEEQTLRFTLNEIVRDGNCPANLKNAEAQIFYRYNFERNIGQAFLQQLKDYSLSEVLYPLGLNDQFAFMSSMKPTAFPLADGEVVVYRIIFDLYLDGSSRLALMLGEDGSCIMQGRLTA